MTGRRPAFTAAVEQTLPYGRGQVWAGDNFVCIDLNGRDFRKLTPTEADSLGEWLKRSAVEARDV